MIQRFSKSSGALISAKKSFFENNTVHLNDVLNINKKYREQPPRTRCKNCDHAIAHAGDFLSSGVLYGLCGNCGHLNGAYEDTQTFSDYLYKEEGGDHYKLNYLNDYDQRVNNIYIPKVDFMRDVLADLGFKEPLSVLDMGCGGGHFVKACEIRGVAARGYDPSKALVDLGRSKIEANRIAVCEMEDFVSLIDEADQPVISMIGVLEHLLRPREAVASFANSNAQFLYISVPLFSFSALLEHVNQDVFPRQLSGGHTHLYTQESLAHMASEFGLAVAGEWWFGTDIVDLYRHLIVKSRSENGDGLMVAIQKYLGNVIDDLQKVLDERRICSEVHMIFRHAG